MKLVIMAYLLVNLATMIVFAMDKSKAKNGKRRVPESTLLTLAFFGPFGAVLGMHAFHHKTRKMKFKLVYIFLILHLILFIVLYETL